MIGEAARALKPEITIVYYGVHPLLHDLYDLVNLDDLGDAGASAEYERIGHSQRCMWAALAASHGMAINTSTGYYSGALDGILLDTAVVGANGLTLGESDADGCSLTEADARRWSAISVWRRRRNAWTPVWLDVDMGGGGSEPLLRSWARAERIGDERRITAAALRGEATAETTFEELGSVRFTGAWALISQDDDGIWSTATLACIPFRPGVLTIDRPVESIVVHRSGGQTRAEAPESRQLADGSIVIRVSHEELGRIEGFILRFR